MLLYVQDARLVCYFIAFVKTRDIKASCDIAVVVRDYGLIVISAVDVATKEELRFDSLYRFREFWTTEVIGYLKRNINVATV